MPLPDAEKDRRLYELLKTQDLENLSYADFQAAAESVFVEEVNEDDLRRIVLIQLARMSVAGEWNGLLNAGGGGGGAPTDAEYVTLATDATLTNERVLTAGTGISLADGGAGLAATIANTGVTSLGAGTGISVSAASGASSITNTGVTSNVAGTGISVSSATGASTITNTGVVSAGAGDGIVLSATTGAITISAPLIGDLILPEYVTLATDTQLQNERVLTAGTGITLTDAGAGSTVTIAATGGGSSGVYNPVLPDTDIDSTGRDNLYMISRFPPWGSNSSSTSSTTVGDEPQYRPFVSPRSGDVLSIVMNVNNNTDEPNYDIGIYSDSDGIPDTLLGKATAALTIAEGTGTITLTPSSTITTVAGTQYHIGWVRTDVSGAGNFTAESNGSLFWCGPISPNFPNLASLNQMVTIIQSGTDNVLPATVTATDCEMTYNNPPRWGLVWS
jgi:hypothetical protein